MKLTMVFLTAAFLNVNATGISQTVTYSGKNTSLVSVFKEVERQTGLVFFYKEDMLKNTRPVSVIAENMPLIGFLDMLLKDQSLKYTIESKTISISRKATGEKSDGQVAESGNTAFAVTPIRGRVLDAEGNPLEGASVMVKGGKISTSTNAEGVFNLNVSAGDVLLVSFVGFQSAEYKITPAVVASSDRQPNNIADIVIRLTPAVESMQDVVVNKGYYKTTQRLNTGDVVKVSGDDIRKQPVTDPLMALEGRVPGMYIQQASGMPGSKIVVQLRGRNSIANGNDPLYIVDGVPFSSTTLTNPNIGGGAFGYPSSSGTNSSAFAAMGISPFNILNPANIESIEILKDADATAIYGSRGANGVVLITTRKGRSGDTKFLANVSTGAGKVTRKMNLLNTQQYLQVRRQAFMNDGMLPTTSDYDVNGTWDTTRYTDWQKVLIGGSAKYINAQASFSGGNNYTQFFIGGGYSKQTTVFPGSYSDQKASINLNLNHSSVNQKFHLLAAFQYGNNRNIIPQADFTGNLVLAPDAPPLYDPKGDINWGVVNGVFTFANPIAATLRNATSVTNMLSSNLNVGYTLFHGLQLKSSFGFNKMQLNQSNQQKAAVFYGPINPNNRQNSFAETNLNTWIIEPQLEYTKTISRGTLNVLVGTTHQQNKSNSLAQVATGFLNDEFIPNVAAASNLRVSGAQTAEYHYVAFFGRVNFNWDEKYLINVTARRDGSSRFGFKNQFGNFGAVGAGWIFSKEEIIKKAMHFLSFGKLRASYGTSGNDQIGDYQFLSTYSPYTNSTYQGVTTLTPTRIANPYFGWEEVKKLEGGIELGFLNDKIFLTVNYYRNRTGNQLVGQPIPSTSGSFGTVQANLPAVVQNSGVEMIINSTNIKSKNLTWNTSINLTVPRNKLISFPGLANNPNYSLFYTVGKSLFAPLLFHYTGLDKQTGLYTFEDINHNGIIDFADKKPIKEATQKYFGGIENTVSFNGWSLEFLFQFVKQAAVNYMTQANFAFPGSSFQNLPVEVLDAWQKPGDNTTFQMYSQGSAAGLNAAFNYTASDAAITDASFIRLKNISLSYNLPGKWQTKMHVQNTRIYFQAQNLLTITSYRGPDPETQGLSLPPLRMLTGGIQIGF